LHTGDIIVAGTAVGRVRMMTNENGIEVKSAGPSVPVEITGLDETPNAGDAFDAVSDERLARELVEQRKQKIKEEMFNARKKVTLDNLFENLSAGDFKELNIIVKADVQGSVEAVSENLAKLSNDQVRVSVIHGGVGAINESDVMLAEASGAIIVGFNVRPDPVAKAAAERDGVDIRMYRVIYDCIEEISSAMKGMLAPKYRENQLGTAEVRNVYKISNVGTIAGCYVTNGKVTRACQIRLVRDGVVICEDKIRSLRRFKDDVKEVAQGYECGIGLEKFADIKEGDIFEAFIMEEYRE
ncbi:MAG: translation initiation factor IF-2, partial [Acutalibacteraceae bacterium]